MTPQLTRVGFLATLDNGHPFKSEHFSADAGVPLVRIRDLSSSKFETFVPEEEVPSTSQIRNGDLLIGMDGDFTVRRWTRGPAAMNQRVCMLRPRDGADIRFLAYALPSELERLNALAFSTTVKHLSSGDVLGIRVPNWDGHTQRRIADYLDHETAEMNAMSGQLEDLIELLALRRVSLIRQQVRFSHSGDRWEYIPTGYLFGSIGSGTTPAEGYYSDADDAIPWVTTSELRERDIWDTGSHVRPEAIAQVSSLKVHPAGSVLVAMYGATIGRLGRLRVDATVNQACCVFSAPQRIDMDFFYYALLADRDDIVQMAVGGGQPNINQNTLRQWRIPLPPLDEQRRIVAELDAATVRIDTMIADAQELNNLISERRSALITEVITGRMEV